jgi:signal transduction histidine kinase
MTSRTFRRSHARSEPLLDAAVAVAVFAASLGLLAVSGDGEIDLVWVPFAALASLPLVARRQAPLAVFVITALGSSVLGALGAPTGPPLGPTLALYFLARSGDGSREQTVRTLAIVAGVLVAHVAAAGIGQDSIPWTESLFGVTLWGGVWLLGDRARLRQERVAELEQRALSAEREAERERRLAAAEERTRIAGDLHDSAGHAINVIMVQAGAARLDPNADPERTRAALSAIEEVARETVGEIDQLVRVLREDGAGEAATEPTGLAAMGGLIERHRAGGLDVDVKVEGEPRPLAPAVDRAAYRILQEALTNAARHGDGAARVLVAHRPGALELTVENGVPERAEDTTGGGHGIVGMRERAVVLGGTLDAGAADGRYVLRAILPVAQLRP